MTHPFHLREEPFEFDSESDESVEWLESDWAEEVWQGEINRSSPDYIRWVQQSLNQILGLRLAVDGDLGSQTRSAIRSFQQRQGLKVDGIVGSQTESALVAAGASPPLGGTVAPIPAKRPAHPNVNTPLPRSGPGFYSYKPVSQQYGLPETIQALQAIGSAWQRAHPQGPRLGIGDISLRGGGPIRGHVSHQKGVDVDIHLVRNDGREEPTRYQLPQYSRAMTQELINLIRANGILGVRYIFFNDPKATGVKPWPNHDNHLHVRFIAPGTPSTRELEELSFDIDLASEAAAFDAEGEWETFDDAELLSLDIAGELQNESPLLEPKSADWEYESALDVLSPSELKAVKITSTFETGRAGGFGGLTGNIDGQGLSFGLLNFTIKAGSLIPLLQEFINKYSARYSGYFGKDANRFKEMVFATKPDPKNPKRRSRDVDRQMAFVNNQMNSLPKKAKGNRIIDPWKTYFGRLEKDAAFQKIQVKAVRGALDRARYWYNYFGFKTERGFAFMFDLVSSHGGWWLNAKMFKGKRRALLQRMIDQKKAQLGRDALTELEKMEVIANMIADVSLEEWREQVRVRKLWFVRGSGKVHGSFYDIKKNFGITDNPPDFGMGAPSTAAASELAW